ncbi:MAG: Uncharacterised protein [Acidimicrobiales bacterium AG-410-I20]|nr:MAG: Uncharacterised protein [Acidimicrobiales bacterium AG-410-I20]
MTDDFSQLSEPDPYRPPQVEAILREARDIIENARAMPLSASSMVNKEELLEMIDEAMRRMPDDLRNARWLLKEREEFLAKVTREGDEILELARSRAERLVQRTEVVRTAEQKARQLVETAREESRRMRLETEDYCDQKLKNFESALGEAKDVIAAGRRKLQETGTGRNQESLETDSREIEVAESSSSSGAALFDQDNISDNDDY